MGMEWYDAIARRNGGYKSNAIYSVEGQSGEQVFEERLKELLAFSKHALDAGCGHGDFTIRMSSFGSRITGLDNSIEMIKLAEASLHDTPNPAIRFIHATTKEKLPFEDGEFDLIYNRRGPTSILNHARILKPKGKIIGIHTGAMEVVKERLASNEFVNIEVEIFDQAMIYFPNDRELAKFLTGVPGNIDYTNPDNIELFRARKEPFILHDGRLGMREWKYIWTAEKR
ncbi:class I SAM-dependent methyltransferase [Cohnella faecalis]|uniref:Class I SAM-dependent methyltransferase n=1 Tax=Cohnella faecalis TaxID=2315694 RepID=A0A398CJB9_9BACL|nr:class I SAM-dependent methyltransferase [Cohnella faecalis]RIE03416.1 class I SAM-dependent methyltransferase [Cohnella faecalis]